MKTRRNILIIALLTASIVSIFSLMAKEKKTTLLGVMSEKHYYTDWKSHESQVEILTLLSSIDSLRNNKDIIGLAGTASDLGFNYSMLGDNILSMAYYQSAVEMQPDLANHRYDLAIQFWTNGNPGSAENEYEKAYKLDSTQSFNLRMYGNFLFCQNQYSRAIDMYNTSIRHIQEDDNINYTYIMHHIAQIIMGNKKPQKIVSDNKEWPYPIVQFLNREINEPDLAQSIVKSNDEVEIRQKLCEALFYVGRYRIAINDKHTGIEMLRQCLNTKLPAYIEYNMAQSYFNIQSRE